MKNKPSFFTLVLFLTICLVLPFNVAACGSPGIGGNSTMDPIKVKISLSDEPVLNRVIKMTMTFGMQDNRDGKNAIAEIRIPTQAFEVVSTGLSSREETITDHYYDRVPDTQYTVLGWHGDLLNGKTYSITAEVKLIKTGY